MILDEVKRLIARQDEDARRQEPAAAERMRSFVAGLALEDLQWHCLTALVHDVPEGDSIVARLSTDPWEHHDPRVVEMWDLMTAPANESVLRRRYDGRHSFNSVAKRLVEKAWRQLQARKQGAR